MEELTLPLDDGTNEIISIVIIHHNRPQYLNILLQSIAVNTFNNNFEIVIVDNASDQESQDYLDEIEDQAKIIRNPTNLFWSKAANIGFKNCNPASKYIVFMHPDVVILSSVWLDQLQNIAESKNSGMISLQMVEAKYAGQKMDALSEWCLFMSRNCVKETKGWDEQLPQLYMNVSLTMKAQRLKYNPIAISNPGLAHHYRAFSVNLNHLEKLNETADFQLGKFIRDFQNGV